MEKKKAEWGNSVKGLICLATPVVGVFGLVVTISAYAIMSFVATSISEANGVPGEGGVSSEMQTVEMIMATAKTLFGAFGIISLLLILSSIVLIPLGIRFFTKKVEEKKK